MGLTRGLAASSHQLCLGSVAGLLEVCVGDDLEDGWIWRRWKGAKGSVRYESWCNRNSTSLFVLAHALFDAQALSQHYPGQFLFISGRPHTKRAHAEQSGWRSRPPCK